MRKPIVIKKAARHRTLAMESLESRVVLATVPFQDSLALWLDADTGVATSGNEVSTWVDQSGQGNDLSALGAGPSIVAGALNGHAILKFDGIDDGLGRTTFSGLPTGNTDRSAFLVANYIDGPGWAGLAYGNSSENAAFGLITAGPPNGRLTIQGWGVANDFRSNETGIGAGWLSQSAVYENDTTFHYRDGLEIDSDDHTFATGSDRIRVGVELDDNRHMDMEIAEILVYDRALTAMERAQVDAYIRLEYFGENTPPSTAQDSYAVERAGTIDTVADGLSGVLDNDFDANLDALSAVLVTAPEQGFLTLNPDGSFLYEHDGSGAAVDTFTYRADDGTDSSAETTVTINITNPNNVPMAVDDDYSVTNGGTYDSDTFGESVLDNDTDADFQPLTATLVDMPTSGSVVLNSDGTFVYTHDGSGSGIDSFTYRASDGVDESNLATVTVTINDTNTVPMAMDDLYQIHVGGTVDTVSSGLPTVLENDIDLDMDPLTALLVSGPTHGSLVLEADGHFVYMHDGSNGLTDSFTYQADDGTGRSNEATVTISLASTPPVMAGLVMRLDADSGVDVGGTDVLSWNDLTSSGNDLTIIDGDPQLVASELNGRNVVRFDGVDDVLGRATTSNLPTANSDRTVFLVANYVSGAWSGFSFGDPMDNQAFGLVASGGAAGKLTVQGWGLDNDFRSTTVGIGAGWLVQSAVVESDEMTHFRDGVEIDSGSQVYATSDGRIRLGGELDDNRRMRMDVAEVLVYDRALSPEELEQVETYLRHQYIVDNLSPVAIDDFYTVARGEILNTDLDGKPSVLANDSDANDDLLQAQLLVAPDHGSLVLDNDGSFVYEHDGSATMTDTFTYRAFDGLATSNVATVTINVTNDLLGDFDADGVLGCGDLNLLGDEIVAGTNQPSFDLNGDTFVDALDQEVWVLDLFGTLIGDANLDFVVDVTDFNIWNVEKFTMGKRWCNGDFNGDGGVDISDFNLWNQNKFTSAGQNRDVRVVSTQVSGSAARRVELPATRSEFIVDSGQFRRQEKSDLAKWKNPTYTEIGRSAPSHHRTAMLDEIWSGDELE